MKISWWLAVGPASGVLAAVLACSSAPQQAAPSAALEESRRQLPAGEIVGTGGSYGSHLWRGIPYASPPLGPLRWRAPQPPPPWSGPRQALEFGEICPQRASRFGGAADAREGSLVGSEDCLTLNVWAPAFPPGQLPRGGDRLPIMVWIHGGGNVVGSGRFYDGGRLAVTHRVLVVSLNYRLGPLGWLRHAALREEDDDALDRSGNYGTLDLIRGLEWLRENAGAFGGDPGNVTIFGESAGGRNVISLLLSPRARGLFQRAIVESGGVETLPTAEAENAADGGAQAGHRNSSAEVLLRLLQSDGGAADRAGALARQAALSRAETAAYLRGRTPAQLISAYQNDASEALPDVPQLFRDGAVIPDADPLASLGRPGGAAPVPVILGSNRDENKLFLAFDPRYVHWWFGLFPRVIDARRYERTARTLARMWKATGVDEPAAALRNAGAPGVYTYRFDWDEEPRVFGLVDVGALVGAAHGLEIPFVFGHWDLGPMSDWLFSEANAEGREWLSQRMMSYWAEFARSGSPGRGRDGALPEWPAWAAAGASEPRSMVFATLAGGGLRTDAGTESPRALLAELAEDPDFESEEARCAVHAELARSGRGFHARDYAALPGCQAWPLADH